MLPVENGYYVPGQGPADPGQAPAQTSYPAQQPAYAAPTGPTSGGATQARSAPTPTDPSDRGVTFSTPPNLPPPSGSGAQPIAPESGAAAPTSPPAPAPAACSNTCRFANNGECDDGRQGSDTDLCGAGTDCTDCGGGSL